MQNTIYEKELLEKIWITLTEKKEENFKFLIIIDEFLDFYKERPEYREGAIDCIKNLITTSLNQTNETTIEEKVNNNEKIDTAVASRILKTIKSITEESTDKELNNQLFINISKLFEIYDKTKNHLIIESLDFFCKTNNKTR